MEEYITLLGILLALLVGLATGKAWERYKLREGRWVDRRRTRETAHFIVGLNYLVAHQLERAIDELSKAASLEPEALETHLVLGNLYREKGQVGRAIQEHQALLQRPRLTRLQHANVLLCLGLDYKRGGFVDRALEAFNEVLRLDPVNQYALLHLEKLYADQHLWEQAYGARQRLAELIAPEERARNDAILGFLQNELGLQALGRLDRPEAARRFEAAIDLDSGVVPAYLNLGDVRLQEGRPQDAAAIWERLVQAMPDRAYLAFQRLESVYQELGVPGRFLELCRALIAGTPQDWRGRLALARHLAAQEKRGEALELLLEAVVHNPHGLAIHQAIWRTLSQLGLPRHLVERYVGLAQDAVFYLDPHVCLRCRYRSTELLWLCPHCHEWNTFVEERIAPARDAEEADAELVHERLSVDG